MINEKNILLTTSPEELNGLVVFEIVTDKSQGAGDYILIDSSEVVDQIFNLEVAALKGKSVFQFLPELNAELQELFSRILTLTTSCDIEFYSSSNSTWYSIGVQFLSNYLYLSFHNITSFKSVDYSLDTFFDFNLEMFSIFDQQGKCIRINKEWENVLGYTFEDIKNAHYADFIHPDDLKFTLEVVGNFQNNQKIFDFTNRLIARDRSYKYIEWRSCFINGLLYSTSRDITQLKLQENEIENQENIRQIVENLEGVFFLVNADMSRLLYITPNYNEVFGVGDFNTADYLTLIQKMIHRDDLKRFNESMDNYRTSGVFKDEYRVWKSKKECIWVYASAFQIFNKNGEVIRHAGFVQDITRRKKAELAERESRKRLDAIINTIPDVLITYTSSGEYLDLITSNPNNRIFRDTDVKGKHISDYFSNELTDLFLRNIKACLEQNAMQTIVFDFEKEGKTRYFENRFSPIDNDRVLSVIRDSTELIITEQRLRFQLKLQQVLIQISNAFLNADTEDFESVTDYSIAALGSCLEVDRFYIFSYDGFENTITNTHEWCEEGIQALKPEMQNFAVLTCERWIDLLKNGHLQVIEDVDSLDPGDGIKSLLVSQGVKSMVAVPLINNERLLGFIGLDYVTKNKKLHDNEFQLLRIFAQNLVAKREKLKGEIKRGV